MSIAGFDLQVVALIVLLITAFIAVFGLALKMARRNPVAARVKAITRHRQELSLEQKARLESERRQQRSDVQVGLMKSVIERLQLQSKTTSRKLRWKLARAGWRGQGPMITFVFMRLILPLVFGLLTALFLFGAREGGLDFNTKLLISVAAGVVGYLMPGVIVANTVQRRQHELRKGFPDSLDLLVICVEAGLSLDAAFARVTDEMQESHTILAEEFGLATAELAFLGDRRSALTNMSERTGLPDFRSLATALIQTEKYGTSLGTTLRVLARENRDARIARAVEKAGRLPATLTVPMIAFILPVLFIVLIGPAAVQTFRTFQ
jgi:tight adherence protein C